MRSLEASRLERRWRILAGALVLALTWVLFTPLPAYATVWPGPDDGAGKYAHCNVGTYNGGGNGIISFACQYTLGTAGGATTNVLTNAGGGSAIDLGTWTHTCGGCTSYSGSAFGPGWAGTNTAGHAWRDTSSIPKTDNTMTASSFSGCTVQFSARGTFGIPASPLMLPCVIDAVMLNVQTPPFPTNYYPGSTAGPALDSTATVACSRTLTGTDAMTGTFTATNTSANTTVGSPDWDWGDSTTHGTTLTKNHTYGALSTMPTGGWTATLTQTFTATSGHVFADGTSSKVVTCQLRVDFLHPDKSATGSNDTSSTGDTGLDACLPSGWSTLNPLAWVGSIGCILKYLFIPQSSTITALGHTWDTATTKLPFSLVNDLVTYIPQTLDDFRAGIDAGSPIVSGEASSASFFCQSGYFCNGHTTPFYGTDFGGGTGSHTVPATVAVTRNVMLVIIILVFVYSCWRGAGEILK